ncbi:hypothetical protein DMA15_11205 [Streptomyces sp. WAC 01529]|uniref:hypothetical protein n=1 Tax=Streptomyces sp. WAC 01529 TaxID=2203205 RepID=UPI000F71E851|nr:hypothetical protein [Streptomyces sp. WAC 01529]AZM53092.1 hypothetical protein DMA15_11205 [Streptomyces sp. WAC 01529]
MTLPEDRWLITASPLQNAMPTWRNSAPFVAEFTEPPACWEISSQAPAMETVMAPLNLLAQLEGPLEHPDSGVYEIPLDPFALSFSPGWDLVLVVDTGLTMQAWFSTANAIAACAHDLPLFRSVRVIRMSNRQGNPPSFTPDASSLSAAPADASRRCMILLLTDGVGPVWKRQELFALLGAWTVHHIVAILQTLPHPAWELAALSTRAARLRAPERGCTNRALVSHDSEEQDAAEAKLPAAPLIPVLELRKRWVEQWVRLLLSKARVHQHVVEFPPDLAESAVAAPGTCLGGTAQDVFIPGQAGPSDPPLTASERVAAFETAVPEGTFRLAIRLAMAPLNRYVMDLIADKSHPFATPSDLSRILTSNLLVAYEQPADKPSSYGRVTFDFADGVRQCLLAQSDSTQTYQTADLLERYLPQVMPALAGFASRLRKPRPEALPAVTLQNLPYLRVEANLLSALSAESAAHRATADHLRTTLTTHQAGTQRTPGG